MKDFEIKNIDGFYDLLCLKRYIVVSLCIQQF